MRQWHVSLLGDSRPNDKPGAKETPSMDEPPRLYAITPKGRQVLHGPTVWCLTAHLRDLLALCDPAISMKYLLQAMPRATLDASLFALWDLGLVEGPAVPAPDHSQWEFDARSRPIGPLPRLRRPKREATGAPAAP